MNSGADQYGFSRATNTQLTNDAGVNWLVGDPKNGISPLADPFPVRSERHALRCSAAGRARLDGARRPRLHLHRYNREHPRVQRWRVGVQRELGGNMMVEAAYWGQWADRIGANQPCASMRCRRSIGPPATCATTRSPPT